MAKQRRDRRTFTEQFKKDLVQQIENGARVSDLAKTHGIQPSQISLWKRKITGKPGKRGRKPGSTNRATVASGSDASTPMGTTTESTAGTAKKATRKRAGRKRGSSKKSSAASAPSAAAPRTTSRASSSGSSNQADVERMIGRLVLENQRLRDQLEGGD